MAPMLSVRDLKTEFVTQDGIVHAVNGISFDLDEGETLGIVGESGCGKSVSMLSMMGLIPQPPGRIAGGSVEFQGRDLTKLS
ncbi:MAG: ATP-binding cassette domain-containing protein, partial [Chloroflexi bacterium]|nr:ATP-binding cassette domain-containing protein [Chloroflexota bacterium]